MSFRLPDARRIAIRALQLVAFWCIPASISVSIYWVTMRSLKQGIVSQVPPWIFWAFATPVILRVGKSFPIERGVWRRALPIHLVGVVLCAAGSLFVAVPVTRMGGGWAAEYPFWTAVWKFAVYYAEMTVVTYAGIVIFAQARENHVRAARAEARLAQSQLQALRAQLHPHFLFNTLHAIGVLVRKGDQAGSLKMLAGVSDLLRAVLERSDRQTVPLSAEIELIDRYLAVEKTRFADRLAIVKEIAPETLRAEVPSLLLQPLVENAIRHGVEPSARGGTVTITARRREDRLVLEVRDDGPGPGAAPADSGNSGTGTGLAVVRARLEQQHPGDHRFELAAADGGGARATIEIPFRAVAEARSDAA